MTILRDPTAEREPLRRARRAPLKSFDDVSVALLDIGKMRGDEFIDRIETRFSAAGVITKRYRKPTNTRVAPIDLLRQIGDENHAVVLALSD